MTNDEFESELELLSEMPYGAERARRARMLVDSADGGPDLRLAYRARDAFVTSACFSGDKDIGIVAIAWMVEQHDRDPSLGDLHRLLWYYKWVLSWLPM